jgi:hypothetical protein
MIAHWRCGTLKVGDFTTFRREMLQASSTAHTDTAGREMISMISKHSSYTMSVKSMAAGVLGVGVLLALATYSHRFIYNAQPNTFAPNKQPQFAPLNPLILETVFVQGAIAVSNLRSDSAREVLNTLHACDMSVGLADVCLPELIAVSVRKDLPSTTTDHAAQLALGVLERYERDFRQDATRRIPEGLARRIFSTIQENLRKSVSPPAKHVDLLLSDSDILTLAESSVPLTSDEAAFVGFFHELVGMQRLVAIHDQESDPMFSPDRKVAVEAIRTELTSAELPRRAKAMGMLEARPSLSVWLARDLIRLAHANDESSDSAWFAFMTSILFYRDEGGEDVVRAMLKTLPTFDKKLYDELGAIAFSEVDASEFQQQICDALKAKGFGVPVVRFCEQLAAARE